MTPVPIGQRQPGINDLSIGVLSDKTVAVFDCFEACLILAIECVTGTVFFAARFIDESGLASERINGILWLAFAIVAEYIAVRGIPLSATSR